MPHISKRAAKQLEKVKDTPTLIGWLRTNQLDIRSKRRVADALGTIGDPLAVDALLEACGDQLAIHNVLGALAKIGDKRAVPALAALSGHWWKGRGERGAAGVTNRLSVELTVNVLKELVGDDVAAGIRDCEAATMAGWERYHRVAWTPIESLAECPLCERPWTVRIEGAVQCRPCCRYFSDSLRRPQASDGSDGLPFGTLTGSSIWTLALTEKWIEYNDERVASGLVRLPAVVPHRLTPTVDAPVAWQFDEILLRGALTGGPDVPPNF